MMVKLEVVLKQTEKVFDFPDERLEGLSEAEQEDYMIEAALEHFDMMSDAYVTIGKKRIKL